MTCDPRPILRQAQDEWDKDMPARFSDRAELVEAPADNAEESKP